MQHNTPSGHTSEQEPNGPGHRTSKTTHQAGTPVNRSRVAQDTAQAGNTPSGHTVEQVPTGLGHRTRNTTDHTGTPVNRSQVAGEAEHAKQRTNRAHW